MMIEVKAKVGRTEDKMNGVFGGRRISYHRRETKAWGVWNQLSKETSRDNTKDQKNMILIIF